ncbi:MAG: helix-turn-helix domain-containing protein [Alistipes sp.]|nr:helix-turn-helix domain-containing protein [Alistipes sp.]
MKEKLQQLMKSEGLTSSRMAEMLGVQPSGISHLLSGRNKPGFDLLQKILRRFPQVNPDWLLLDAEQMYRPAEGVQSPAAAGELFAEKKDAGERGADPKTLLDGIGVSDLRRDSLVRVVLVYADRTFEVLSLREP